MPPPQTMTQVPLSQASPPLQDWPQPPQWAKSVSRSTQEPLQSVSEPGQPGTQVPLWQCSPLPHAFPQAPQWLSSTAKLAQVPLQSASVGLQRGVVTETIAE